MALIGKIRNNPTLVLLFIGGGIALFVLSDIMNSGNSGAIGPVEALMGRAGEVEIERNEFERTLGAVYTGGDNFQNRDNLFQFYVNEGLVRTEADAIGLTVSDTEMEDLTFGPNPSPVIRRNFSDPQTGQLNREFLNNVQRYVENGDIEQGIEDRQLSPNFVPIWKYQRREVNAQRLQEKMTALVSKGFYAPGWMAQDFANAQSGGRDLAVVRVPFDEIDNSEVEVADADLQAYIDENRSIYDNDEETRVLTYATFEVVPSAADSAATRERLSGLIADWRTASNDSTFAIRSNGTYGGNYELQDRLSPAIADVVFDELEEGEVYGPYVEGNAYKLVKLTDRVTMTDSADTRHILRNASTPEQFEEAERLIDSLKNVLRASPRKWEELASEFSQDPGSASNGGEYENVTPGQFVRPFDALLFRTGEIGELYSIRTSFGVHLVEVLDRSRTTSPRVKVGYIVENIEPSIETQEAVDVASQEFLNGRRELAAVREAAEAAGARVSTTRPLSLSNYNIQGLGGGQEVRDMMCWAFSADEGEVSDRTYVFNDPQLFYRRYYVVAGLEDVIPEGVAPVEAVRENVEPLVRNRAKGAALAGRMQGKSPQAIAAEFDSKVDTLRNVNLTASSLTGGYGAEPAVIARAATAATGTPSEPIIGQNGVFVIVPLTDASATASGNLPVARNQMNTTSRLGVNGVLLAGLRRSGSVEDARGTLECN